MPASMPCVDSSSCGLCVCVCPRFGQCLYVCVLGHLNVFVQMGDEVGGLAGQSCVSLCVCVVYPPHTPLWVLCESPCVLRGITVPGCPPCVPITVFRKLIPPAQALCESHVG